MTLNRIASAMALAALVSVFTSAAGIARPYANVTAYSRYGNGEVRAPVRAAEFGYQVKLPGGPWIYCEKTSLLFDRDRPCSETLRRQTIDFWDTISEEQSGDK